MYYVFFAVKYDRYTVFLWCFRVMYIPYNVIFYRVSGPLLVGGLLAYFNPDGSNTTDLKHAYMYASGIVFSLLIIMILQHSSIEENLQCAMKMRVACCSIMFRKVNLVKHYLIMSMEYRYIGFELFLVRRHRWEPS